MSDSQPVFAALYDPVTRLAERRFGPEREWLTEGLSGRVLDLGCGTGATFPYLCDRDLDLHAVEPDPHMRKRARRRATDVGCSVEIHTGTAESVPYPDGSFDAVVVSLVLCSVSDVEESVEEIARVLAPGGECRFLEHVRADGRQARIQEALTPCWRRVAGGCHLDRETPAAFVSNPDLRVETLQRVPIGFPPVAPILRGRVVRE
ncbi:class I SAM-dependent methyltransferase [Halalkalicoccus jeotgali]|uniref:Methyltransferase type 11 n=1 Tax=Halalkalicoccus jeotgali (strain DSM 18796 / CECT 7217 / JCM 14584 / KCTC 4019 / B3) TaxID=795797 RepID=D8J7T0_HALJB|nr:class I SAM-dependent methyltransferase [Halalkalicoccus jeotgali]ADJ16100.1 Methyltransferase type 11 [Halalkalicoccus jeotgali B3]ELY38195.1 type 11 methyltransferase [Halalkalicoccus jeotgali B3]